MRLALVVYGSIETRSGGYLYDRKLVEHLRQAGDTVEIIGIPWRNYARHLGDNLNRRLTHTLEQLNADLLLEDELNHPSLIHANRMIRRNGGPPIIGIVHHLRSMENHPRLLQPLYRTVERRYLAGCDGFIFNSLHTQMTVEALLGESVPGVVATPAADHLDLPAAEDVRALLAQRAHRTGPLRILAVGNVIPRKEFHTVIAAMAQLPAGCCVLDIVGSQESDPAYVARCMHQIGESGLDGHVALRGYLTPTELQRAFREADVLALPSFEGFGIVYLEAMAYGLPVIASTAGAATDLVADGRTGFLIAPGDVQTLAERLSRLCTHRSELIPRLGAAAHTQFAALPTWSESMERARLWLHERNRSCAENA